MPLLKHLPEDFIVEELSTVPELKPGPYHYLYLSKKTYPTMKACQIIADAIHVPLASIGFAGNKDKQAVTKQLISIKTTRDLTSLLERFKTGDLTLEYIGTGDEPIVLGHLRGNRFIIVVRQLTQEQPKTLTRFVNFFGDQRFSKNNSEIGKLLVKQQFKEALVLIDNPAAQKYLEEHPANAVDALRKIPKQLLKMYVHAYQSMFFNKTVAVFLDGKKDEVKNRMVPLVGFGYECDNAEIDAIIKKLLDEEGITERDFIIRPLPDISCEGGERTLFAEIHDLEIGPLEDDDLHPDMKKCTLIFWLDKGCYATEAVKQMIEN
ncbi:MAG: tRNA pseudouridine(13) synthase TruD [Candidatus Woesearchaeota archaeon]|nr:tRNA pseudouridine(13) synthase TruD [Candidatus Woesearchaeota archaeon]